VSDVANDGIPRNRKSCGRFGELNEDRQFVFEEVVDDPEDGFAFSRTAVGLTEGTAIVRFSAGLTVQ
jgi:hypothetical protein